MRVDGAEFGYKFFAHDKIRESQREMISDGVEPNRKHCRDPIHKSTWAAAPAAAAA